MMDIRNHTLRICLTAIIVLSGITCYSQTLNIWPGVAPGSENWTQKETTIQAPYGAVIINVTTPTLTVYLPEKSKATGTGVIVAPGGGWISLALDSVSKCVALWTQER